MKGTPPQWNRTERQSTAVPQWVHTSAYSLKTPEGHATVQLFQGELLGAERPVSRNMVQQNAT
eukprot:CAMPEP_0177151678 /NCGR_PEP_ID=MMETSP0367-20130122/64_1 /TAXON_ID=447022 ORGANISM="Scrippsiella hangoei-like, Strain SHHI-4" /NCGR_SAMPLE_ID=MMETSP0367 /ASSEMBLY_ACC=CAM_ASM_000362 /LENGTH=62 /DNA_ID=CAMNT_0018596567 /DNA_START=28 /DNA_END=212 /DNA_ORIENTATION=+